VLCNPAGLLFGFLNKVILTGLIQKYTIIFIILFCFPLRIVAQDPNKDDPMSTSQFGDSISTELFSFNGYPFVYYTPETELAGGVGGILIFKLAKYKEILPSKITISAYYTSNDQYKASFNPVLYMFHNKLYINTPVSFGHYEDRFWGIGNKTKDTGTEKYTRNVFSATINIQAPPLWFAADRSGIILDYDYTEIEDKKENEFLLSDSVAGSNGSRLLGIGYNLTWDTRDQLFFPNSGSYQFFKLIFYPDGNDFIFYTMELDIRNYRSFSKDHVFATNLYFGMATEQTPFYKLPALGGQNRMRGYYEGRYRDYFYSTIQFEYRQYFWKKFGFVAFAGLGDVAKEAINMQMKKLKYSYGAGLRYLFNKEQKVNLRMDIGFGEDGNSGLYFGLEEAF
jgi:outer membrane protein assembly factor BamA